MKGQIKKRGGELEGEGGEEKRREKRGKIEWKKLKNGEMEREREDRVRDKRRKREER